MAMGIHVLLSIFRAGKGAVAVHALNSTCKLRVLDEGLALEDVLFVQLADGDAFAGIIGMEVSAPTMLSKIIVIC